MGPQRRRPRRRLTEGGGLSVTLTDCGITSVFNICSSYLLFLGDCCLKTSFKQFEVKKKRCCELQSIR